MGSAEKRAFKYVFVPVDMGEPIKEMQMQYAPGKEVECLLDAMKEHFRATAPPKSAAQQAAQRAELISKLPAGTELNENLLNIATSMQMVENIALLSHSRDFGFIGVNLYVDDEGSIKGAPRNTRASEIAHCCGKPIDVKGDAFLARVLDDGDNFERLDFTLPEVSSEAEWVKCAQAQAVKQRAAQSGAEVLRKMQENSAGNAKTTTAQVRELTPAEAEKEQGNAAFKKGEWEKAARHYSAALEAEPLMIPALTNRALMWLKLKRWEEALADCIAVLEIQPKNVKALFRAALAEEQLDKREDALLHLEQILDVDPDNKETREKLTGMLGENVGSVGPV